MVNFANLSIKFHQAVSCSSDVVILRRWSMWVQARVTPGMAASAQTPGKATPPTSAAGRRLSALLQCKSVLGSPSPCPRPRTSPPRVVFTGSEFASSTRTNCGSEASPGTPLALDLLSPTSALGNRPRAMGRFSMALPSDAAPRAVGIPGLSPTASFQRFASSPSTPRAVGIPVLSPIASFQRLVSSRSTPSLPRAIGSSPRGSLLGAKVSGHTPTAPFAEPAVSVHGVVSAPDQGFSPSFSLPEATTSSAALVPLQSTPVQQPLQARGPSARSVAASNGRTRTVPSSAVGSGQASRRSSISTNSIADRPAWSPCFSRCTALHSCPTEDMSPHSKRLTTASPHRATGSSQPSPSRVRAVAGSPAVEPSSVRAMRRAGSNAAAARLMSTAKTGGSNRTAAQPGGVRPTVAQPNAGRAAVQGTSRATRAGQSKAGPAAPVPAVQRPATLRSTARSTKAAAPTPAEQSVAKQREATSGRLSVVQSECEVAPAEPKQTRRGQDKTVKKKGGPTRTQPARRAKDPGHVWRC